jgi:hypothetical protein
MVGQSVPISAPAATIAGFLGGELCRAIAKELGGGDFAQRFATAAGHTISSAVAGYAVNTVLGLDATGAVVTTAQTVGTAMLHDTLRYGSVGDPGLASVR